MEKECKKGKKKNARFIIWSCIVGLLLVFCIVAPQFASHDPYEMNLLAVNQAPSAEFIMGTDYIGRCILCRLLYGAARSVYAALFVVFITFMIGVAIGSVSGYIGGTADLCIMRFVDSVQAFPSLVFTISIAAMLGGGMGNCMIAMSAVGWTTYARLARSKVLSLKERTFVSAARVSGMSGFQILVKTIIPNSLPLLIVQGSMHIGNAILEFAGLSFLGLGTAPPYPEWGNMLNDAKASLQTAPWTVLFPGLAILCVVMIMSMFGDSLNEVLNPKKNTASEKECK